MKPYKAQRGPGAYVGGVMPILNYAVIIPTAVVAYSNIPWMIEYLVSPTVDSIKKLTRARKLE